MNTHTMRPSNHTQDNNNRKSAFIVNPIVEGILNAQEFTAAIAHFRKCLHSGQHKPRYCKIHGSKYASNINFLTFGLYAILRGKPLSSVTHDVNSERFKGLQKTIARKNASVILKMETYFGLTYAQGDAILTRYQALAAEM